MLKNFNYIIKHKDFEKAALSLIILYFAIFTLILVLKLRIGVSPDSLYHLEVSKIFASTWGIPENSPVSYLWRDITRMPYLYFWINGRLLNFNILGLNEIIYLRFFNLLYSLGTVITTYLIAKEILKNQYARLLTVFLLTNSLMFVFLSAAINYDNLANLFAVVATLFFVKTLKDFGNIKNPLWMLIFLLLGVLTKFTLAPLAFVFVVILGFHYIQKRKSIKVAFSPKTLWYLVPIFSILIFFNLALYGTNIIKYKSLVPECEVILTHEQCLENGVYYRDQITMPSIEIDGIGQIASMIRKRERIDPITYTFFWIYDMSRKVVGIMGDQSLMMSDYIIPFYLVALIIAVYNTVKYWEKKNIVISSLTISTIFYLVLLLVTQNYKRYLYQNIPSLALQGRYMFPVISSFYIVLTYYLFKVENKKKRDILIAILVILYLLGCMPYFVTNVPSGWFQY